MSERVARMVAEAKARMADADIIGESLHQHSDSQSLLRILALEVLLKAVELKTTGSITRSHRYLEIWRRLPSEVQAEVIKLGTERYAGHVDLSYPEKLLCNFEWLFTSARYGYEFYEGTPDEELHAIGQEWIARGSPTEEADIQYRPTELAGLSFGLLSVAERAA